jgi:hypothetical protein
MYEPVVRISQGFFEPHLPQSVSSKLNGGRFARLASLLCGG